MQYTLYIYIVFKVIIIIYIYTYINFKYHLVRRFPLPTMFDYTTLITSHNLSTSHYRWGYLRYITTIKIHQIPLNTSKFHQENHIMGFNGFNGTIVV